MSRKLNTFALAVSLLLVVSGQINAQYERNYGNAQARIRERIIREQGGNNARVNFNDDARFDSQGGNRVRVRGTGMFYRSQYENGRQFSYDSVYDVRNGNIENLSYQFGGGGFNPGPGPNPGPGNRPGRPGWGGGWGGDRPNGTARYSGSLVNGHSNKCLDISDYGNSYDGTRIQQWSCAGQPNQIFDVISVGRDEYAIFNRQTRKVFDIPDNRINQDGAELQQFRWSGRANQRFRLVQSNNGFRFVNVASGKCLDVDSQSNKDGARIHQWNCGGQRSQEFGIRY